MAHFRATIQGNRGMASRLGTKKTGLQASVNGWNVGVTVEALHINGEDTINVFITGGSTSGKQSYTAFTIGEKCGLVVGETLRKRSKK